MAKKTNHQNVAWDKAQHMTFKDLRRECVLRGMPFKQALEATAPELTNYFINHYIDDINTKHLDEYDKFVKDKLKEEGTYNPMYTHPSLQLGFVAEEDEETGEITKRKKIKGITQKKEKRKKTKDGIFAGTKKAYTFQLQKEGISLEEATKMVIEKFPEAKEKSINIWFKKSLRLQKAKTK